MKIDDSFRLDYLYGRSGLVLIGLNASTCRTVHYYCADACVVWSPQVIRPRSPDTSTSSRIGDNQDTHSVVFLLSITRTLNSFFRFIVPSRLYASNACPFLGDSLLFDYLFIYYMFSSLFWPAFVAITFKMRHIRSHIAAGFTSYIYLVFYFNFYTMWRKFPTGPACNFFCASIRPLFY